MQPPAAAAGVSRAPTLGTTIWGALLLSNLVLAVLLLEMYLYYVLPLGDVSVIIICVATDLERGRTLLAWGWA